MAQDMGPADDPDPVYGVRVESVLRCQVCGYEVATHRDTWSDTEIARRVEAVLSVRHIPDRTERQRVLRDMFGYELGSRPC